MSDDDDLNKKVVSLFGDQVKAPLDPIEITVRYFNLTYASITIGGTHWILKEENGEVDFMSRKAFIEKHEHDTIEVQSMTANNSVTSKKVPKTKLWLESKQRRKYDWGVVCDPSNKAGPNVYNLWKGFVTQGIQDDCHLTSEYIHNVLCDKDALKYKKFMQYWAHMRQKPWEKPEYAIVLKGLKGVGKSFFLDIMQVLIDGKNMERSRHCYRTSNSEDIYGRFRDHLQNRVALFLEEVTFGGDRRHIGTLNDYITGKTIKAEKKNGPILDVKNIMRICMTANPGWTVPASVDERRYEIYYVNDSHQQDHSYFASIYNELNNGGYEAFMYELEHFDISDFNIREALRTDALVDEIKRGFSPDEKWWDELLMYGQIKKIEDLDKKDENGDVSICIVRENLRQNYYSFMRRQFPRATPLTPTEIGIKLGEFLPLVVDGKRVTAANGRVVNIINEKRTGKYDLYCYVLPSLRKCRDLWDFRLNRNYQWPIVENWQNTETPAW